MRKKYDPEEEEEETKRDEEDEEDEDETKEARLIRKIRKKEADIATTTPFLRDAYTDLLKEVSRKTYGLTFADAAENLRTILTRLGYKVRTIPSSDRKYDFEVFDPEKTKGKRWCVYNLDKLIDAYLQQTSEYSPFLAPPEDRTPTYLQKDVTMPERRQVIDQYGEPIEPKDYLEQVERFQNLQEMDKQMANEDLRTLFNHFEAWCAQKQREVKRKNEVSAEAATQFWESQCY